MSLKHMEENPFIYKEGEDRGIEYLSPDCYEVARNLIEERKRKLTYSDCAQIMEEMLSYYIFRIGSLHIESGRDIDEAGAIAFLFYEINDHIRPKIGDMYSAGA